MSNVIQFLESMGQDAAHGNMSQEQYTAAVKALDIGDVAEHALLNRDHAALCDSLGGRIKMMMVLVPAEDDDGEDKQNDDDQRKEEEISIN